MTGSATRYDEIRHACANDSGPAFAPLQMPGPSQAVAEQRTTGLPPHPVRRGRACGAKVAEA